jgi:predicted transposase YbfD/YdcC
VDISEFGRSKEGFFRSFLELPNGIPSHDTFGRVFAAMDAGAFERSFQSWVKDLAGSSSGKLIALDGKTIRRSLDQAGGRAAIHMVSAWVYENHAVFGQLRVADKSNEITAIPKLLEMLDLKDATVTIDAIGCQRDIAGKILERGGQYVLAVKGNQGTLHEDVKLFLDDAVERGFKGLESDGYEQLEKGHGRIETRRTWTTGEVEWVNKRHEWPGLKSIAVMDCQREIGTKTTLERRYFISSLPFKAAQRMAFPTTIRLTCPLLWMFPYVSVFMAM